ncbi:MFS transporter [Leeia aquatica]|uniref:MFS transporter n=1 Tax=Leeia aquatica TaxID=2725557 RepID=A0A847RT93_9NEIS|nr:MFS transporter [Leeia aquatica]NLR74430.1 MFS transporter [Leeia aquatica]
MYHPARILLPFALGYFFSYLLRTVNAVIAPWLTHEMGLSKAELGALTSAYFFTFALAQLPLGILMDRLGPRRLNAALLLVAAAGCAVFGLASSSAGLMLGRALIGLGVSGCLMCAIKANTEWFPLHRLPALNSWILFAGLAGSIVATLPVAWLLSQLGFQGLFMLLVGVGVLAAFIQWRVVPEPAQARPQESLRDSMQAVGQLFRQRRFWSLAPLGALVMGLHMAMQGLWLAQWLRDVRQLPGATVDHLLFQLALVATCGALLWGQVASRLQKRGIAPLTLLCGVAALNGSALLLLAWNPDWPALLLIGSYSFTAMAGNLAYAVMTARFDPQLAGRANTALNLVNFVIAFLTQSGFGYALEALQPRMPLLQAYPALLTTMAALVILSVLLAWRGRRAHGVPPSPVSAPQQIHR